MLKELIRLKVNDGGIIRLIGKWLNAGVMEDNRTTYPNEGTPQGGVISPTLANMTLDGLEEVVRNAVPRRSRVNFIRYADDCAPRMQTGRFGEETRKEAMLHMR